MNVSFFFFHEKRHFYYRPNNNEESVPVVYVWVPQDRFFPWKYRSCIEGPCHLQMVKIKHLTTFQLLYRKTLETYFIDLGIKTPRKRPGQQNTRKRWAVQYLMFATNKRPSQKAHFIITHGFYIKTLTLMGASKWKVTRNQLLLTL